MDNKTFFDFLKQKKRDWTKRPSATLTQREVNEANAALFQESPTKGPPADIGSKKGPLTAIVGAVAAASLLVSVPKEEGTSYKAYRDVAGIWTICQGDTKDVRAGLIETPEGCRARL